MFCEPTWQYSTTVVKTRARANKVRQYRKGILYERFPSMLEKRDIKEETKVEIWPSHILFTAYNWTFITVCIELECLLVGFNRLWGWSTRALFHYLHVYILQLWILFVSYYRLSGENFRKIMLRGAFNRYFPFQTALEDIVFITFWFCTFGCTGMYTFCTCTICGTNSVYNVFKIEHNVKKTWGVSSHL